MWVNQTNCLQQDEGWLHMDHYDDMGPKVRQRMRESPFNLCAACVREYSLGMMTVFEAIEVIEGKLRQNEE